MRGCATGWGRGRRPDGIPALAALAALGALAALSLGVVRARDAGAGDDKPSQPAGAKAPPDEPTKPPDGKPPPKESTAGEDLESLLKTPPPTPTPSSPAAAKPDAKAAGGLGKIRIHVDKDVGVLQRFAENGKPAGIILLGNPSLSTDEYTVDASTIVVWLDASRTGNLGFLPGESTEDERSGPAAASGPAAKKAAPASDKKTGAAAQSAASMLSDSLDAVLGVYAEGAVELTKGLLSYRAEAMYLDPRRNQALLVQPRLDTTIGTVGPEKRPVPLYIRAERARILSSGFAVFDEGEVTTSRANDRITLQVKTMSVEEYGKAAANEDLLLGFRTGAFTKAGGGGAAAEKKGAASATSATSTGGANATAATITEHFIATGITVRGERLPLAYMPEAEFGGENGLTEIPTRIRRVQGGKRSSLGYWGFVGFGETFGDKSKKKPYIDANVDVGGYTKRGPAGGLDVEWHRPETLDGRLKGFAMHDATGDDRTDYDAGAGFRGFVEFENQWTFVPHWRADVETNVFTDRGVNREYFESDARDHKDRETYGRVRYEYGGLGGAVTAGVHARNFVTESYGVPEASAWSESLPIATLGRGRSAVGLDLSTEARLGRLVRRFDEATVSTNGDGYEATRFDVTERVYAPFSIGDVRVSPFVGGRWTGYYDRTDGGDDVLRGAMEAGIRGNLQFHCDLGGSGGPWSLNGLRHIIDVDVGSYARFLDQYDPNDVPFFDRVDTEENRTELFVELRNRLETSRGQGPTQRNVAILDARLRASFWPDEVGPYGRRGPGEAEGWLTMELIPGKAWLLGNALAQFEDSTFVRSTIGVLYNPHDDFSLAVGIRHVHAELLSPWVDAFYRWNDKWGVHAEAADDVYRSGDGSVRLSLLRYSQDHQWEFGMSLKDRGRDVGFFWNFVPLIGGAPARPQFQDHADVVGARP